tara:strand:+ start:1932 stop:3101 length:1170 start_codon:yes stop_codon:yes gene_type:complete
MASREDQEYSSQAPAPYIGQFLQQDIFPFAQQFLRQQFRNYGQADSSPYTYTGQRVADFDPREQYGMQLADSAIGSYRPYLGRQAGLLDEASSSLRVGQDLGRDLLGRSEASGYASTRGFDPRGIGSFYNPFEDQVVDQVMKDVTEGLAKSDIGMRDKAVKGGAFGGTRSRLTRGELASDVARGAAEQIGQIRSGGYRDAANRAQQAFESQQQRQAGLAGLQSQLGQNIFGMGLQGGQGLSGFGGQYGQMAQLLPQLQQQDIQSMMNMGGLGRGRQQSLMDLNYQNFVGQYNLPMQTLQNVGALTASLGPMAGGYGYAGGSMAPGSASVYTPQGVMGTGLMGTNVASSIAGTNPNTNYNTGIGSGYMNPSFGGGYNNFSFQNQFPTMMA